MGTSNENQKNGGEEEVEVNWPWGIVPYSVRIELIKKLNPDVMSGNDWRMLASELGYTTGDINYIESEKNINTAVLFKQYDTLPGASLNNVFRALVKMERQDCVDIIRRAMPEIQQAYNKANMAQSQSAAATLPTMPPMGQFQWSGSPCSCPYAHHPTSSYGSHGYCSFGHGFSACHGHHHGASSPPYQLTHSPHTMCQTNSHTDTALKTFEPRFSPPHYTMPLVSSCHVQPDCQVGLAQQYGSTSPSCSIRHASQNQPSSAFGHPSFSTGHSSCRGSPTYSPNQNVSSILLPNNISAHDNSNLISSDSNSSDSSVGARYKFARQFSNECNTSQALNGDKRLRNNSSREVLNSGDFGDNCCGTLQNANGHAAANLRPNHSPKFVDSSVYLDERDRYYHYEHDETCAKPESSEFMGACSPNSSTCSEANSSLAYLEKLATVPDKFKPTDEYKKVVVEQKIEADKHNRHGKSPIDSSTSQSSKHQSASRTHASNITPEQNMRDFQDLSITTKPVSLALDSKQGDSNTIDRNIKVFVTYSYDNESHGRKVLSLCRFLQSNGFACSVDVSEKTSLERYMEQLEICRKWALEADFILVCISPKYIKEISTKGTTFFSQTNERKLHARQIYELMENEYQSSQNCYVGASNSCNNSTQRFVPLLFSSVNHSQVPKWMMNGAVYTWPEQYEDLAWMLTKPQERFIERKNIRDNQLDKGINELQVSSSIDRTNLMSGVSCNS